VPTKLADMIQGIISAPRASDDRATRQLRENIGARVTKAMMLGGGGCGGSQGIHNNMQGRGGRGRM
jgi:hypothetical protein